MKRTSTRVAAGGGLLLGTVGIALWRWKRRLLADLEAGSELIETDRGPIEVARRGSGYPVLVLHATPGGYDQGLVTGEITFGDDVDVIAPSRPGYLRTPLDDNGSPSAQAALFVALLDELDVDRVIVVGVSGGGPAALQLAADSPERVAGLILAAAVTDETDTRTYDVGSPLVDPILTSTPVLDLRTGVFGALRRFAPNRFVAASHDTMSTLEGSDFDAYVEFVTTHPAHRQRELDLTRSLLPASPRVEGTLADESWFRRLPLVDYETIECPTLVVHGEYDAIVPIGQAEAVTRALPNAELVRLEADHLCLVGPDAERGGRAVESFTQSVVDAERTAV